ncbi:MAG TPA: CPBP family intramembrane glutamic endopeptidase [Thermoanaerobaculia bacterium]|nr:CPBP family intramembrane glutamic endopeptidase [Thermoanaerobaculia bacterium]
MISALSAAQARPPGAAQRLRGFGPLGVLAVLVILAGSLLGPPVGALLVLAWARLSGTPPQALGFRPPRSWSVTLAAGVASGIVLKLGMKAVVMPLLGAPASNMQYRWLVGNSGALPGMVAVILVSAGFGEEVVFRGYLFERLGKLLGPSKVAVAATVLLSAALFALAHSRDQGLPGVEQAAVTGLAFGGIFAWRKQIWAVMIAHVAFDLTAVMLIYGNWEVTVAHLLFR